MRFIPATIEQEAHVGVPKVIASNQRLEAGADRRGAEVLAELDSLVNKAIAITEVCGLRGTEVDAEALG